MTGQAHTVGAPEQWTPNPLPGHSAHPRSGAGVLPSAAARPGTLTGQPCPFLRSKVASGNSPLSAGGGRGQEGRPWTLVWMLCLVPWKAEGWEGGTVEALTQTQGPTGQRQKLPSGSHLGLSLGEICFLLQDRDMSYFFS